MNESDFTKYAHDTQKLVRSSSNLNYLGWLLRCNPRLWCLYCLEPTRSIQNQTESPCRVPSLAASFQKILNLVDYALSIQWTRDTNLESELILVRAHIDQLRYIYIYKCMYLYQAWHWERLRFCVCVCLAVFCRQKCTGFCGSCYCDIFHTRTHCGLVCLPYQIWFAL